MKFFSSTILVLSLHSVWGCGTEPQGAFSTVNSIGSWSSVVGGSLANMPNKTIRAIEKAEFYRVRRPVGLGIVHEYMGIRLQLTDGTTGFWTSGLIGEGDGRFFVMNFADRNLVIKVKTTYSNSGSAQMIRRMNKHMVQSPYHNRYYYGAAMTSTPVSGRPCANVVAQLVKILKNF
jgi:hypothetical protein